MGKSDAKYHTAINALSRDGWKESAEDYDIDPDTLPPSRNPNDTWLFSWVSGDIVYTVEYYGVGERKEKVFICHDPLTGEPVSYYQQDIKDVIGNLANRGFTKVVERKVKYWRVYRSIVTCTQISKDREKIAGKHILIAPVYGEWSLAGNKECYEGVVRLTKGGQYLRNMIMSFNADIVAHSPKRKLTFSPEQIGDYKYMYGGNDDYSYYLQNRIDENDNDPSTGPISYMENLEVP